jgi:hypothetical protein
MNNIADVSLSLWNFDKCCRDLKGARQQRDLLKRLLTEARRCNLPGWTAKLTEALALSRKLINRISARRSWLAKRLNTVNEHLTDQRS